MNRTLQYAILGAIKVMKVQLEMIESLVTSTFNEETRPVTKLENLRDESEEIDAKLARVFKEEDQ